MGFGISDCEPLVSVTREVVAYLGWADVMFTSLAFFSLSSISFVPLYPFSCIPFPYFQSVRPIITSPSFPLLYPYSYFLLFIPYSFHFSVLPSFLSPFLHFIHPLSLISSYLRPKHAVTDKLGYIIPRFSARSPPI